MQSNSKPHPAIFGTADKRLRFGVSDVGEFIDSIYREQQSSKFFGKMIGRHFVSLHGKAVFTAADIVCEGYLAKKGSWMKNWKKRYFILRKDIRALCYYPSREDLTLLGSIPLDIDTRLINVKADDADGFQHVVAIESDLDDGSTMKTYVRFETFEKMKAWMLDIKNEAQNMMITPEDQCDWWEGLFENVPLIEPKNTTRRDGLLAEAEHEENQQKITSVKRMVDTAASEKAEQVVDSDDESDEEGKGNTPKDAAVADKRRSTAGTSTLLHATSKLNKKIKHMKVEKPPGPPPFDSYDANKFETAQGAISGVQISLQLCNICTYQDRLFVVIFGSNSQEKPLDAAAMQNLQSSGKKAPATPASSSAGASTGATGSTTAGGAAGPSQSSAKWIQLCRTEVRVVTERPSYSESYVGDVKIFFNVLESLIPESCKEIKIVVYRQENNDVNVREGFKTANADLNTQLEIARTIIQKKVFDFKSILKIKMKVKMQLPVDIAVPLFKDAEVTLGMVKLTSFILQQHRQWMTKSFKISPYSEILYSFGTNAGMTLSLEQLYASRYATAIGQSMLQLFSQERHDYLQERIRYLKENFASAVKEAEVKASQNNGTDTLDEKMGSMFEPYKQAIEAIDEMFHESCELSTIVLNNCENVSEGREVKNNVIPVDIGGGILRRSVWKKITAWQYCTTNLNIHMLMNKYYCFHEIETQMEVDGTDRNIHYIPSITLGCPAAHELGFSDGGLRRVFAEVSSVEQKLHWMQAIQYPTLELVEKLFQSHPKEALSLFGAKCGTISTQEELANTLRRKGELSRRLDMVGCQALGCAVAIIRTTCMLATIAGGNHFDCLARSLKIGFLVMFQSFLSTQGAEIGMIEDLEMSALWLSLITVRLVTNPNGSNANKAPLDMSALGGSLDAASPSPTTSTRKKMSNEGKPIYSGVGDGIITRRDENGRLIVDIEISAQEAAVVMDALNLMGQFDIRSSSVLCCSSAEVPYAFRANPKVVYGKEEVAPRVYAVVEVFSVAFTQGVNEMQTLANLASSRDVLKQVDINQASLARMMEFYRNYREALDYQLTRRTPEMVDCLSMNTTAAGANPSISLPQKSIVRRKSYAQSFSGATNGNNGGPEPSGTINTAVEQLKSKVLSYNDRLLDQLHEAVIVSTSNPYDKHVDVLLRSSAIGRQIGGTVAILCKSGKDRTSMGVTLENARSLVEELGVLNGQEVCQLMRAQGVRRMNVYANTGQSMFAFNQIQRRALPNCYRPPPGSHAGNVTS